jgi:hypothetical protein
MAIFEIVAEVDMDMRNGLLLMLKSTINEFNNRAGACYNMVEYEEGIECIVVHDQDDSGKIMSEILSDLIARFNIANGCEITLDEVDSVYGATSLCTHHIALHDKDGRFIAVNGLPAGYKATCIMCGDRMNFITTRERLLASQKEFQDR